MKIKDWDEDFYSGAQRFLGFFTAETLMLNLYMIPVALLGVFLGVKAHNLVSDRLFFGLTYVLLAGAGSKLIWDALT